MGVGQEAAAPVLESRASGPSSTGSSTEAGENSSSSSSLAQGSAGWRGVLAWGVGAQLVPAGATGLSNEAGEYNCFLNVIIQCLWHCADFRAQVGCMLGYKNSFVPSHHSRRDT
jgi:hypothetical protein